LYEISFKWIGGHLIIQNCWTSQSLHIGQSPNAQGLGLVHLQPMHFIS